MWCSGLRVCLLALFVWQPLFAADKASVSYAYLTKQYPEPPPLSLLEKPLSDDGLQGARLSNHDNNLTGGMLGYKFELVEAVVSPDGDVIAEASKLLQAGEKLIVADLETRDLLLVADLPEASDAIILNIRSSDGSLRLQQCRPNVFHMAPSRAMRADALAQYLIWKKWRRWFLVSGKKPQDKAYADAVRRAAKRFGGEIVDERSYQLETGSRRMETGHQQIQTQMPNLTRGAPDHHVVVVADEMESFGLYLPYRTTEPRPVVGTYGLVATAWHRSFEQYGGMTLQHSFEEAADRDMTERDYLAWLSLKLFAEVVLRGPGIDTADIRHYLRADDFTLAGYKGRGMNFRRWNQQLRQPLLLASARSLVSMAPLEGFLHQKYYTDTLGYDPKESDCDLAD